MVLGPFIALRSTIYGQNSMELTHQKKKFSIPNEVHYLNCATMSPLLKSVEKAGIQGVKRKSQPYEITQEHFFDTLEIVKSNFATLINCPDSQRIAVMGSVSYGMATIAKNVLAKGISNPKTKILLVGEEFPSDVYAWEDLQKVGAKIEFVSAPETFENRGKLWNEKFLAAIDANTLMVCISPTHWADGTLFDLLAIGERCRAVGALYVIDGTQHVGAYPFDIQQVKADALVCGSYKWLLGPYGSALTFLGEYFDEGTPLEQNWAMRKNSNDFKNLINYQSEYRPKAFRYNVGEVSNFINLPMINAALEQINAWTPTKIQNYAQKTAENHLKELQNKGYWIEEEGYRSHHLLGIRVPKQADLPTIQRNLLENKVFVSYRGTAIRVSVHVWNGKEDLDIFTETLLKGF
jgi:selenocysteine lyase/cysteine desulfurase